MNRANLRSEKLDLELLITLETNKLKLIRQYKRRLKKVKKDLKRYFNE